MDDAVRKFLSENGKKGGVSRSDAKKEAGKSNLAKANARRLELGLIGRNTKAGQKRAKKAAKA